MSAPSDPSLAEVAELLAEMWSRRSKGERSTFIDTLAATTATPVTPPLEDLTTVSERAALSGAVAPRDLVRGMSPEKADHALDALAPDFDRTLAGDRWTWTLRTGPRQGTLARLAAARTLPLALADVADIDTDPVGYLLRQLAAGQVHPSALIATASQSGLAPATVLQALTWAAPLGGFAGDVAEARRRAHLAELSGSYKMLLRHGIFGRQSELLTLQTFAEMPVDPSQPVPLLPVTGIGGVGKSTLLASLIQPYLDRLAADDQTAPAVVVIDFDRVLFRVNAEVELSFELTRQLGCAHPVASADFSVLRYQAGEQRRYTGTDVSRGSVEYESESRDTSDFESQAGLLIQMHGLQARPVLLVLDTFEEWQRERPYPWAERASWNDPEQRILEWINRLRWQMGLGGLRVVVSGRAEVAPATGVVVWPTLMLEDLDQSAALELLGTLGITGQAAGSLVGIAGTNPLTLRVAARFYQRLTPAEQQHFLAGEAGTTAGLDAELRRGVLYDRFLSHIEDSRVQRLAHPGLVLRRVTPDLVRYVLAGLCGPGEIDASTATVLTEKLADEIWLVRRTPDGLRHQPDVRRAMLRMMSEDPEQAEIARQIHEGAISWYDSGRDQELSQQAAEVESFYHRLMLEPDGHPVFGGQWEAAAEGDEYSRRWVRLAQALGPAVAEFSPGVAAQVRVLRGDDIPDNEAQLLPKAAWSRWIERRGAALVAGDEGTLALDLFTVRLSGQAVSEEPAWLAQACSDTARWDDYWEIIRGLGPNSSPERERSGRYAMLNSLFSQNPANMAQYDAEFASWQGQDILYSPPPPYDAHFERRFLELLCTLGIPTSRRFDPRGTVTVPAYMVIWLQQWEVLLYPVDQIRRALIWIGIGGTSEPFLLQQLAGLFRPNPQWVIAFSQLIDDDSSRSQDFLASLANAAQRQWAPSGKLAPKMIGGLQSHDVLGTWAASFAHTWGDQIRLRFDKLRDHPELIYVLRGDNPEMRPAIRRALAVAASENGGLGMLANVALPILPIPAIDLWGDAIPPLTSPDARKALVQLVEYVDRSGVMREFLDALRAQWPNSELLNRVAAAFAIWDTAYAVMLDALAVRLRSESSGGPVSGPILA